MNCDLRHWFPCCCSCREWNHEGICLGEHEREEDLGWINGHYIRMCQPCAKDVNRQNVEPMSPDEEEEYASLGTEFKGQEEGL